MVLGTDLSVILDSVTLSSTRTVVKSMESTMRSVVDRRTVDVLSVEVTVPYDETSMIVVESTVEMIEFKVEEK